MYSVICLEQPYNLVHNIHHYGRRKMCNPSHTSHAPMSYITWVDKFCESIVHPQYSFPPPFDVEMSVEATFNPQPWTV